jgi:hypothetical protein
MPVTHIRYIFHLKIQLFVTMIRIQICMDPHWFGYLDPAQCCGSRLSLIGSDTGGTVDLFDLFDTTKSLSFELVIG